MNILIIGSGGREHALAWKIAQSPKLDTLYCTPGNLGTVGLGRNVELDTSNHELVIEFAKENNIDLVVVGPEQPLVDGIVDSLNLAGIAVFGPDKYAAQLEGSKVFAKEIMESASVPTASYKSFVLEEIDKIKAHIKSFLANTPLVLKADGLAAGKGVFVSQNKTEALTHLNEMLSVDAIKNAASTLVIESFLEGEEASVFALCDGENYICLSPAQDHKRIGEKDTGVNTGGMGAYAPAPIVNKSVLEKVMRNIIEPVLKELKRRGHPYKGVLYCGLMIHNEEPSVVEFNCRFGDPECQVILPNLKSDLLDILLACVDGNLGELDIELSDQFYCSVVLASDGYPQSYEKGFEISGLDDVNDKTLIFHCGTTIKSDKIVTNGGRVLNVVGSGESLKAAIENSYEAVNKISFTGKYYRRDIGQKGLKV